jgi:hypothetical protein
VIGEKDWKEIRKKDGKNYWKEEPGKRLARKSGKGIRGC